MKQTLETMLELQNQLNIITIRPNWRREGKEDFCLALQQETAEFIDHMGWKWWKKQEPNLEAAKMEVIDMIHFALSDTLRHFLASDHTSPHVVNHLENLVKCRSDTFTYFNDVKSIDPVLLTPIALARYLGGMAADGATDFGLLVLLGEKVGMTIDEQLRLYQCKAVLNLFRQQNGYREGTYKKIWARDDESGRPLLEDNDVMVVLAETIDWKKPGAANDLYSRLTEEYENVLKREAA